MESNVVQKMRMALRHCIEELSPYCDGGERKDDVLEEAKQAVALPLRNCDIGSAEEQESRYDKFCDSHKWVDDEGANGCMSTCPLYHTLDCGLHWAQMPYKEGARNESV